MTQPTPLKARKRTAGQGVIEYAGALVVASILISLIVAVFPDAQEAFFSNTVNGISDFLVASIPF